MVDLCSHTAWDVKLDVLMQLSLCEQNEIIGLVCKWKRFSAALRVEERNLLINIALVNCDLRSEKWKLSGCGDDRDRCQNCSSLCCKCKPCRREESFAGKKLNSTPILYWLASARLASPKTCLCRLFVLQEISELQELPEVVANCKRRRHAKLLLFIEAISSKHNHAFHVGCWLCGISWIIIWCARSLCASQWFQQCSLRNLFQFTLRARGWN